MAKVKEEWLVVSGLVGIGLGAFLGIMAGYSSGKQDSEAKEVFVTEVSGDTNPDVVIKSRINTSIYLGQRGSELCKKLEDVEAEAVEKLRKEGYQRIRDQVESKYSKGEQ